MFSKYFEELEQKLVKAPSGKKAPAAKGKTARQVKSPAARQPSPAEILHAIEGIIPSRLKAGALRMIDQSGYAPEGIDFVVYKELCRDMESLMGGFVPSELVYASCIIAPPLNHDNLKMVLGRVIQAKKVNRYTETESDKNLVPAFVIAQGTDIPLPDMKKALLDYYMSHSVDYDFEFDILMVLGKGLVIKDWREKRSFIALETGRDTLMWFFILMNEYLDVEKNTELDLRAYVKRTEKYNEY
ncbi:MAG: hypothetical protein EPN93_06700 [Spirochaetes bacterium]|nr:MAG: hypothetical protein EPN93_06700 [Spirochaetota bacterium]